MKAKLSWAVAICLLSSSLRTGAQGMAVNTTGAAANSSAMLDVSSTTKGMLAPRMTAAQRAAISAPATGLLVYQTDAPVGFYAYDGSAWSIIGASSSKYIVPMSSVSPISLTYTSTGVRDTVSMVGLGFGKNQWVNINGGSYVDVSGTLGAVNGVQMPFSGTVTSFTAFFKLSNYSTPFMAFADNYTLTMSLYYAAPPLYSVIGTTPFYPVPGASVSVNLNTACGICVWGETVTGSVSGLSYALAAGSSLMILCTLSCPTTPSYPAGPLPGYVTASVGMQ